MVESAEGPACHDPSLGVSDFVERKIQVVAA